MLNPAICTCATDSSQLRGFSYGIFLHLKNGTVSSICQVKSDRTGALVNALIRVRKEYRTLSDLWDAK